MEEGLSELLALIRGQGRYAFLGTSLHVYPNGDERNKKIYVGCCELERLGLVSSRPVDNHLVFEPML